MNATDVAPRDPVVVAVAAAVIEEVIAEEAVVAEETVTSATIATEIDPIAEANLIRSPTNRLHFWLGFNLLLQQTRRK